jgi:hypothetical protein
MTTRIGTRLVRPRLAVDDRPFGAGADAGETFLGCLQLARRRWTGVVSRETTPRDGQEFAAVGEVFLGFEGVQDGRNAASSPNSSNV